MAYVEDTQEYRGYTISIEQDTDATSPRDWDNAGALETWERDYISPDGGSFRSVDDVWDWLTERRQERKSKDAGVVLLALNRNGYDGSISASEWGDDVYHCIGVAYITYEDVRRHWNVARITPKVRAQVLECLRGEVSTYSQWATGDVWGYVISDGADDHIDSCWGFFDNDDQSTGEYALEQGKEAVDYLISSGRLPVQAVDEDAAD